MWNIWQRLMEAAAGWGTSAIMIRMAFAMVVGVLIGIDRGLKRRGAGIKTHTMVCLGSALRGASPGREVRKPLSENAFSRLQAVSREF